jgi:hypothetical protein
MQCRNLLPRTSSCQNNEAIRDGVCFWRSAMLQLSGLALPRGEKEPVDDPRLPDVYVPGGSELARIAGKDARVVRQVIVEPEVGALRVH